MKRDKIIVFILCFFFVFIICNYSRSELKTANHSHLVTYTPTGSAPLHYHHITTSSSIIPSDDSYTINTIYVSIKSTGKYHQSRLKLLMKTWLQTVPHHNVHVVTDTSDDVTELLQQEGYHVHIADCPKKHVK
jgi:hypothetical protein